ncbi:hypothetical protein ES676_11895 [Bizionia saleffrena]|uniref:Uncharacterized protein n=1 Tax=Bizionia saleffrena TaxID=291189 RepID=A0A8H2LCQ7_9FLAO|nr:hypothetical protein [Bizionia saleffrena]TYB71842.1 hypothetical protein ES676_11895 [Bizionia saleffrena]
MTFDAENKTGYFTKDKEVGRAPFYLILTDEASQVYGIHLSKLPGWLCTSKCVLDGFAMSLLDGPAPIMDSAAALYTYVCVKNCKN